MASFTDIIPKFNPYIQQLPVDAMVKVGMEKQKRYDEGLQRIQSQIEQVAGLSVLRPQDKQYLQSKLGELGNNLRSVAAGDFSNFQLVNSVSGMVGQVVKDPFVISAVKSTMHDQKNMQKIEEDRAAGKLGPENEYHYLLQRQKYLQAGLKNQDGGPVNFSGSYIPFKDVRAKLRELAKDVGVDENTVQNLFNPDGSVNKVMVETYYKGKDVNKIYDAFVNGLDEGDYQQLAITGMYKYRNASAQDLVSTVSNSNAQFVATLENKKVDIETEISNLRSKLPSAKADVAEAINKKISSLTATIGNIDKNISESNAQLAKSTESILAGNEDYLNGIRGRLHTNSFLTSLSRDFSEKTSHTKFAENPLWKAIMEENKFALDKWYKEENLKIEKRKAAAAEKANLLKEKEMTPVIGYKGELEGDDVNFVSKINSQFQEKTELRDGKLISLAQWQMRKLGWDEAKIKKYVDDQSKALGNKGSEEDKRKQVMTTFGIQVLSDIKTGKTAPSSEIVTQITELEGLNNFISGFTQDLKTADKQAAERSGKEVLDVDKIMKSTKPITINYLGKNYSLSPSDQIDLAKVITEANNVISSKVEKKETLDAKTRLMRKFGGDGFDKVYRWGMKESEPVSNKLTARDVLKSYIPIYGPSVAFEGFMNVLSGEPFGGEEKLNLEGKSPFQKVYGSLASQDYKQYQKVQEEVYKERFSAYFPKNESVVLNEKSRPFFEANLAAMLSGRPEYVDLKTKMDDPKSQIVITTTPSITGFGGNEYSIKVIGKDGVMTEPIAINGEQYTTLLNKAPDEMSPIMPFVRARIEGSPDKSSNIAGIGNLTTSFFGSNSFTNLTPDMRQIVLGADFVRDNSGRDQYFPKIYYRSSANDINTLDVKAAMTLEQVLGFPQIVTNNTLKSLISSQ